MRRRALVTGGAGFIGSHLCEALLEAGWQVDAIDDLSTGAAANLDAAKAHPGFGYAIATVLDRPLLAELLDRADVIFHLAAAVGVRLIVDRPVHTIETNIRATELVLELAARKSKPVLLASTSEVYGKRDAERFAEDDDVVLGPTSRSRWCYAASKMIDEFLALAYATETGLPVSIVRLFNTIGPRQSGLYGMVVPRFVRQALLGEPITVYGDGAQRRSFTWVGDVVRALIELVGHPEATGRVFNVGHTEEITIEALARLVKEVTGSASPVVHVSFEAAYASGFEDMPRRLPDLTRLERLIGYRPTLGLREMLERIVAHEREQLEDGAATRVAVPGGRAAMPGVERRRRERRQAARSRSPR